MISKFMEYEMTCAVCKQGKGPEICEICGFTDNGEINREFPIAEDANYWLETAVKPYRIQWEAKKREDDLLQQLETLRRRESELLAKIAEKEPAKAQPPPHRVMNLQGCNDTKNEKHDHQRTAAKEKTAESRQEKEIENKGLIFGLSVSIAIFIFYLLDYLFFGNLFYMTERFRDLTASILSNFFDENSAEVATLLLNFNLPVGIMTIKIVIIFCVSFFLRSEKMLFFGFFYMLATPISFIFFAVASAIILSDTFWGFIGFLIISLLLNFIIPIIVGLIYVIRKKPKKKEEGSNRLINT